MAALTPSPPAAGPGEVTLVDKPSSVRAEPITRKRSIEEVASLHSFKSGSSNKSNKSTKSDVDRLIDAISGPLAVGEPETEEQSLQRSNSKGSVQSRQSFGSLGTASSARIATNVERPGGLTRSKSYGAPEHLRSAFEGPPGSEFVTDNKTLLKAIRMPDEYTPTEDVPHTASRVLFNIPDKERIPAPEEPRPQDAEHLKILVAEDDPINSRIILKRLEKNGHEVHHTVNGEECASAYGEAPESYDVVLMDMQMPIVDGLSSTKMIRSHEKSHSQSKLSPRAATNGRVPIFAVSASLVERERQTYINAGFDGWVLKPIDFKRLNVLLLGIVDNGTRNSCLYQPGQWERGGWFDKRQPTAYGAATKPSEKSPVQNPPPGTETLQPDVDSLHSSESGSTVTPLSESRKPLIHDERLDAAKEAPAEEEESDAPITDRPMEDITE